MAARRITVRKVPRDEASGHWDKAREWIDYMEQALKDEKWNAAGLQAIYACIAACDAFTIRHRGERSSAEGHLDAVRLFERVTTVVGVNATAGHLKRVLEEKGLLGYSPRSLRPEESTGLCHHARRFVDFVRRNLD